MRKFMSVAAAAAVFSLSVSPVCAAADTPAAVAISPAKQALLVRLDKAMNFEKMMKDVTGATLKAVLGNMRQIMPGLTDEQGKAITEAGIQVNEKYIPKMKAITFQSYGEVLNEAELTAMVEFYESAQGQAILNKVPEINRRSLAAMSDISLQMQKEMIGKMCEKVECPQSLKDRVK